MKEVRPATISYSARRTHQGRLYTFDVPELQIPRCANCSELLFGYSTEEQIEHAFRAHLQALLERSGPLLPPRILDDVRRPLLGALQDGLRVSASADFCVGYFRLTGWKTLAPFVDRWPGGEGHCCRLLVSLPSPFQGAPGTTLSPQREPVGHTNGAASGAEKGLLEEFRQQLSLDAPSEEHAKGFDHLAAQLRERKLIVKAFLPYPLHVRLYLLRAAEADAPLIGFLGTSNLTMPAPGPTGDLNIDVVDAEACCRMAAWFEERWQDGACIDITADLVRIFEDSRACAAPSR